LKVDLDLKRRVEVHEIEERKNQHINDLIKLVTTSSIGLTFFLRNTRMRVLWHPRRTITVSNAPWDRRNHKRAFDDMKGYYNMITEENLQLIKQYQKQLEELRERVVTSEKKLQDFVKGEMSSVLFVLI
jgi:hypothetical protein